MIIKFSVSCDSKEVAVVSQKQGKYCFIRKELVQKNLICQKQLGTKQKRTKPF